jgi:hypothetical protein
MSFRQLRTVRWDQKRNLISYVNEVNHFVLQVLSMLRTRETGELLQSKIGAQYFFWYLQTISDCEYGQKRATKDKENLAIALGNITRPSVELRNISGWLASHVREHRPKIFWQTYIILWRELFRNCYHVETGYSDVGILHRKIEQQSASWALNLQWHWVLHSK